MTRYLQWLLFLLASRLTYATTPVYLQKYLQPDNDVDRNTFLNPTTGSNICSRQCVAGAAPKICYYKFVVENYATDGDACGNCPRNVTECYNEQCIPADGYERGVISVNRKIPGPSIEVCLGDRIIVDVTNNMAGRTTAIHWHGVFQQGSQYMDGVPMLTQCSIYESDTFRYDFVANNEGTHFWHSHDGLQKLDGLEGSLVVRSPQDYDPNGIWYDYDLPEHKIFIMDWLHLPADDHYPGLLRKNSGQSADSFLINGLGRTLLGDTQTITPYANINVEAGNRYRMRIVGGLCTVCGAEITFQNHRMLVIATDGNPIAPTRVDGLVIFSGERYDVVIEANQSPGPYWIHVKGLGECANTRVYQLGVLNYQTATLNSPALPYDPGYDGFQVTNPRVMNPENGTCQTGTGGICITQLINSNPVPNNIVSQPADINLLLTFGFYAFSAQKFFTPNNYERFFVSPELDVLSSTMNNISFVAPPAPPLSQPGDVPASALCPSDANGNPQCPGGQEYCECVQIVKIPLGSVVQIVLADVSARADLNHPFHLHGYAFYALKVAQYAEGETAASVFADSKNAVNTQSAAPVLKDAIAVPSNGYAIVKFQADNPGYWFLHCHFMYHLATGMGVVLQVGENADVPAPPAGFPKCGSFTPQVYTN